MRRDELIGLRLVIGLPGLVADEAARAQVRTLHAGGFIPFARNYANPEQFRALLQGLNDRLPRPLLVMVDQEGGRVIRFRDGVTAFPAAGTVGASGDVDDAARQGAVEAQQLHTLGVHVNLAPCVDVVAEGSDPIIGDRSYGSDPARVSAWGAARIRGLQGGGLAACAKHFPGLGAVPKDPHRHLPAVDLGWDAMRRTHLPPFRAAIEAGVATIMSSHVCYPRLGLPPGMPATFLPQLTRALLRDELGFTGLLLTDDLEMGALGALCSIGEAAVRAVEAGHDLLLVCSRLDAQREVFEALREAYQTGRLDADELDATAQRIMRFRARWMAERKPA